MKAKVIIGSQFGDEGKGLITDYITSKTNDKKIVIRFNGGSQAGHTVVTPDGNKHVFSHIGSGMFCNTETYLSEYFICNPIMFVKEIKELSSIPKVYIAPNCLLTTPYDMLVNQILETVRNEKKHGSCGLGINETIKRNKKIPLTMIEYDVSKKKSFLKKLAFVKEYYEITRLEELHIKEIPEYYKSLWENKNIIDNYINDLEFMLTKAYYCQKKSLLNQYDTLIFEGAQGLLLDQNNIDYFPHVTHSKTGISNVLEIIQDLNIEEINITYVTRCYTTRHGEGRLNFETLTHPYQHDFKDATNTENKWQGKLRYGILNLTGLIKSIKDDLYNVLTSDYNKKLTINLAITCLDQLNVDKQIKCYENNVEKQYNINNFINAIKNEIHLNNVYLSFGPTRNDVIKGD